VSRIFVELYLDEDVDVLISDLLRSRGFVAATTVGEGQLHNEDAQQLAFAVSRQMAIRMHNRADFEALAQHYFTSSQTHYGIIIAVRRPPHAVVNRLLRIFNAITADEMQDQVLYI
jgi:hypothetical protein